MPDTATIVVSPSSNNLQKLFTHLGLDPTLEPSLYIDWQQCTYTPKARVLCCNYLADEPEGEGGGGGVVRLEFQSANRPLSVRMPVRVSGGAKIRSLVAVRRYSIQFNKSTAADPTQTRVAEYRQPAAPAPYRLYQTTRQTQVEAPPNQHIVQKSEEGAAAVVVQRLVGSVPSDVRGQALEIVTGAPTDPNQPIGPTNPPLVASRLDIPATNDGLLPAPGLGVDVSPRTPTSIAWGLLMACCHQNTLMVLHTLQGLVAESKRRGLPTDAAPSFSSYLNSDELGLEQTGVFVPGFEDTFVPGATIDDQRRTIASNAMLGWAVCHAIRFLGDHRPLNPELLAHNPVLTTDLANFVQALGTMCARAVVVSDGSSDQGWVAEAMEANVYNPGVRSRIASYWCALFFNELLQITYLPLVHSRAARLHLTLADHNPNPQHNDLDPFLFSDTDAQAAVLRAWWLWQVEGDPTRARQTLVEELDEQVLVDLHNQYHHAMAAYLWHAVATPTTDFPFPEWLQAYIDSQAPKALGLEPLVVGPGSPSPLLDSASYLPVTCLLYDYNLLAPNNFNLRAHEARALVTWVLSQLRRMWPTGWRWGSWEVVHNTASLLGSLMWSEAWLYFDYYLLKCLADDANTLSLTQADFNRGWLNTYALVDTTQHFGCSDGWRRAYVDDYINSNKTDLQGFLRTMGYANTVVSYPNPRPFCLLLDDSLVSDRLDNYSVEMHQLSSNRSMTDLERRTIVYQPAPHQLVNQTSTPTSSSPVLVNDWGGLRARRRPGPPYRNQLASSTAVAAIGATVSVEYDDLAIKPRLMLPPGTLASENELDCSYPEWTNPDLFVRDGTMLIKPLEEYVPVLTIDLGDQPAGPDLAPLLDRLVAAGVTYRVVGTEHNHGNPH